MGRGGKLLCCRAHKRVWESGRLTHRPLATPDVPPLLLSLPPGEACNKLLLSRAGSCMGSVHVQQWAGLISASLVRELRAAF